jgi:DNA mismatch endonuclease (patch repair protein)
MSSIRKTGSKPEVLVRRAAHRLGYRFRINRPDLPGTPDIVFPSRRCAIFVHGCFWHQHAGCARATVPTVRQEYWLPKLARTKARDATNVEALEALGWRTLALWECELSCEEALAEQLTEFLDRDP